MTKSINKEVSAKEKIENITSRIKEQKKELRQALEDVNLRIQQAKKKDIESLGFDILNIQKNIENEELKTLITKRNAISRVLEKDNYYDMEFCNIAKEYIEEIREEIKRNDKKIQENWERVEQAKVELEKFIEKIIDENNDIGIRADELLNPLGAVAYGSGYYELQKIERRLEKILNK